MDSNNMFSGLVRILSESHLLLLKNKSLMSSVALLILLLHSFIISCKFFILRLLMKDFAMKETRLFFTSPHTSQYTNLVTAMTEDLRLLAALVWFFLLLLSLASLFSSATVIFSSAITYGKQNLLSFKDLLSRLYKPCKRLLITWFYISLFDFGYLALTLITVFAFTMSFASPYRPTTFVYVVSVPVLAFMVYLGVVWNMAVVVSVLEETSGLESIGKASQILKGLKGLGFLVNIGYASFGLIVHIWWYLETKKKGTYDSLFLALVVVNVTCLIRMSHMMAFTVFYHMCKFNHGEEVELLGNLEYTKLPNEPMIIIGAETA